MGHITKPTHWQVNFLTEVVQASLLLALKYASFSQELFTVSHTFENKSGEFRLKRKITKIKRTALVSTEESTLDVKLSISPRKTRLRSRLHRPLLVTNVCLASADRHRAMSTPVTYLLDDAHERASQSARPQTPTAPHFCCSTVSSGCRHSDLSLTNSLATSSPVRCESIRSTVHPVSSSRMHLASGHQQAQLPRSATSLSCRTATPIRRSSRAKQ